MGNVKDQPKKVTSPRLREDGKILFHTPEELADYLDKMIPSMHYHEAINQLTQLNAYLQNIRANLGCTYPILETMRKRLYRRIEETKRFEGNAPVPNTLIRNAFRTKEAVREFGPIFDIDSTREDEITINTSGIEISKSFENALGTREAQYIIDAINWYVKLYRGLDKGGSTLISYEDKSEDWECYVIRDSFDNICKNCNAKGDIRKKIKSMLFGNNKPLEYVKMFLPMGEGKRAYAKVRFISSRIEAGVNVPPPVGFENVVDGFTEIGNVSIEVNAKLYRFLEYSGKIPEEVVDYSGGFQLRPLALSDRIHNEVKMLSTMNQLPYLKDKMQINMEGISLEKIQNTVSFLLDRWNTGLENRKTDMVWTHNQLSSLGLLPTYGHRPSLFKHEKRHRDIDAISRVLNQLITDSQIGQPCISNCTEVLIDPDGYKIIMKLKGG